MAVYGIVAEWHPFHAGHRLLIEAVRAQDPEATVVSVMSGPFSQRGEPALFDKWTRAEAALAGGVDLVFELHQAWATASLADFAGGAVTTLIASRLVDALAFGSECGDPRRLKALARLVREEPPQLRDTRRRLLDQGLSFAAAQQGALEAVSGEKNLAQRPNDRLAMHYLATWPEDQPFLAVQRHTAHHGPLSGSTIRAKLRSGIAPSSLLPEALALPLENALAKGWVYPDPERLYPALRTLLLRENEDTLAERFDLVDGSQARYLNALESPTLAAFRKAVQSRHLSLARIDRDLLSLLAPVAMPSYIPYLRLLGASELGRILLKYWPDAAPPLLANLGRDQSRLRYDERKALTDDLLRQDLAALYQESAPFNKLHRDYLEPPRMTS